MLQIMRVRAADAGRYACVAVNEAGQDSIRYDVRVLCELPFSSECQKEGSVQNNQPLQSRSSKWF